MQLRTKPESAQEVTPLHTLYRPINAKQKSSVLGEKLHWNELVAILDYGGYGNPPPILLFVCFANLHIMVPCVPLFLPIVM